SVEGIALGKMVRGEDVPYLQNSPLQLTAKAFAVVDMTGVMPVAGISAEDISGDVFGHFRFELSVYRFGTDRETVAFLLGKKSVPLEPVDQITRAEMGSRIRTTFASYTVTKLESVQISTDLTLEETLMLVPTDRRDPLVITQRAALSPGDFLSTLTVDGYVIDGRLLKIQAYLLDALGAKVVVVDQEKLTFAKGTAPIVQPTTTPFPVITIPALSPTALPTVTSYTVNVTVLGSGLVTMSPPGGAFAAGTPVTLTASPAPGYVFDSWSGDATGTAASIVVTVDRPKNITARFRVFP
ncbi:MAG: hypothetical protein HY678_10765, partial [Chloroflexi bacterium]|nr:hypothetical protein [Chloroflexota bacterium]